MKIYLGSVDLIKVKNYIKTSPHMKYVTDIVSIVCKDVAVVV